nr:response regulator [Phyllobacterium zundukense]
MDQIHEISTIRMYELLFFGRFAELATTDREIPIVFITGHGDIPMSVQPMKGGAIEFLTKPFRDQALLEAIQLGRSRDRARRENEEALVDLRERFASPSPESGKVHRSRLMRKMKAHSLLALSRTAEKLQLVPEEPQHC